MLRRIAPRARPLGFALVLSSASACSARFFATAPTELPFDHVLDTPHARVEVANEPFSYRIRDDRGRLISSAFSADDESGYAPIAWTSGAVRYASVASPGYTSFTHELDPWRSEFRVEQLWQDADGLTLALVGEDDAPGVTLSFQVRPGAVRVHAELQRGEPRAWSFAFQLEAEEAFLGFGERFNRTNQRGLTVFNWSEEGGVGIGEGTRAGPKNPWPSGAPMTSYPVPFFLSSKGYGLWLDTSYRSEFELGSVHPDAVRVWHVGKTTSFEVFVPQRESELSAPYQVIDSFTKATGRPLVPPKWAFGARRRVNRNALRHDVPEIQAMRDEDLAITAVDDAMHFFPNAAQYGREAELASWVVAARRLGYHVNGYYNSMASSEPQGPMAAFVEQGLRNDYFLRKRDGTLPDLWIVTGGRKVRTHLVDFTSGGARDAFQATFEWAVALGYSGTMYDFGEYVPWDTVAANGMSGEELHNLYPVLYARALFDANRRRGRPDWFAFMRSGYTGASAFVPMVWSGDPAASFEDADGLPSVVRAGINLGISGVPHFGGDIGGYHCVADGPRAANEELWIRWIQHGALTPNMQDQDACVGSPRKRKKASLWTHPGILDAYRRYARLHTRLFPYLYTLSVTASRTGAPLIRHPLLEHPEALELASVDDAYYLGPALYVAPVVLRGARTKTVQLPPGTFVDLNEPRVLAGGRTWTLDAPLETLPLLLRSGELLPLLDTTIDTLAEHPAPGVVGPNDVLDRYHVQVALSPGQRAELTLYDGTRLEASLGPGRLDLASLGERVEDDQRLRDCPACYRLRQRGPNLVQLELTTQAPELRAGGLRLAAVSSRKLHWELFLIEPKQ